MFLSNHSHWTSHWFSVSCNMWLWCIYSLLPKSWTCKTTIQFYNNILLNKLWIDDSNNTHELSLYDVRYANHNIIGMAIDFDYCCCWRCFAVRPFLHFFFSPNILALNTLYGMWNVNVEIITMRMANEFGGRVGSVLCDTHTHIHCIHGIESKTYWHISTAITKSIIEKCLFNQRDPSLPPFPPAA